MKEDSLLSSLSNASHVSYFHSNHHSDFFNDSTPFNADLDLKPRHQKEQEEVNLNFLPVFNGSEFNGTSPKNNVFKMAAYWTVPDHELQGHSDDGEDAEQGQGEDREQKVEERERDRSVEGVRESFQEKKIPLIQVQKIQSHSGHKNQTKTQKHQNSEQSAEEHIGTSIKNQTKNIPKNYGKAMIAYIEKGKAEFHKVLQENGVIYEDLIQELYRKKKTINTIANLRQLWVDFKFSKCMRILSNQFLRKYALQYIFNSRICNYTSHVKYRRRLQQAIATPYSFKHIKQY